MVAKFCLFVLWSAAVVVVVVVTERGEWRQAEMLMTIVLDQ